MLYQIIQRQRREAIFFYQNKGRLLCLGGTSFFQPFWKCRVLSQWELCSDKRGMWDPIILTRMPCFCLWILSTVHGNSCFGVGEWGGLFNVLNCFQVLQSPSVSTFKGQTWPHWNTSQPVTEVLTFLDKSFEPLTWWKQNPWPVWVLGFWKSSRRTIFPGSWCGAGSQMGILRAVMVWRSDGMELHRELKPLPRSNPTGQQLKQYGHPWLPTSPKLSVSSQDPFALLKTMLAVFMAQRDYRLNNSSTPSNSSDRSETWNNRGHFYMS